MRQVDLMGRETQVDPDMLLVVVIEVIIAIILMVKPVMGDANMVIRI